MKQLTVDQAAPRLAELIYAALQGEDVILIHQNGSAVELIPTEPTNGQPQFGSAKGLFEMSEDFDAPLEDFREYTE